MEFWTWDSQYDQFKRAMSRSREQKMLVRNARRRGYDEIEYYKHTLKTIDEKGNCDHMNEMDVYHLQTEKVWWETNRPYYRIFPPYIDIFSRTSLAIPCEYIKLPYPAFTIYFPKGHEPIVNNTPVHSMMIGWSTKSIYPDDDPASETATLMIRIATAPPPYAPEGTLEFFQALVLPLFSDMDFDQTIAVTAKTSGKLLGGPLLVPSERKKDIDPKISEQMIPKHDKWQDDLLDEAGPLYRIALSVLFLATGGDKLIEPDVLNKDFPKYLDAVNRKRFDDIAPLADRANRKRKQEGHAIGRLHHHREKILGQRSQPTERRDVDGEGRELSYQHQRAGHLQMFWTGPGREVPQIKFINQLTVRPDLPPDPRQKGHRTLTDKP